MGTSMSRLNNQSRYHHVDFNVHNNRGSRSGGLCQGARMQQNDGHAIPVEYNLVAYDHKGRHIKQLRFISWNDATWEIHDWGAKHVKCNYHSEEKKMKRRFGNIPRNPGWENDQEAYYNEMDRREEQRRREEEARRREEARQNAEATQRETSALEATLANTSERRREMSEKIAVELQQKRQMAMVETQQSIGWRTEDIMSNSNEGRETDANELAKLAQIVQEKIEAMQRGEDAVQILEDVVNFIKTKPNRLFDLYHHLDSFLQRNLNLANSPDTDRILKMVALMQKDVLEYFPVRILKTLLRQVIGYRDNWDIISNKDTLDMSIYLFRRMGSNASSWNPEEVPVQLKLKMVNSLLKLSPLPGLEETEAPETVANVDDSKLQSPSDSAMNIGAIQVLDLLLEDTELVYPKGLAAWYLDIVNQYWSTYYSHVEMDIIDIKRILQLVETKKLQPSPNLIDFLVKGLAELHNDKKRTTPETSLNTSKIEVAEKVLRISLDAGMLTPDLLRYLENCLSLQGRSTLLPHDIFGWISDFASSGGSIPYNFFTYCLPFIKNNVFGDNKLPLMSDMVVILDHFVTTSTCSDKISNKKNENILQESNICEHVLASGNYSAKAKSIFMRLILQLLQTDFPLTSNLAQRLVAHLNVGDTGKIAAACVHAIAERDINLLSFYSFPGNPFTGPVTTVLHIMKHRPNVNLQFIQPIAELLTTPEKPETKTLPPRFQQPDEVISLCLEIVEKYARQLTTYWKRDLSWFSYYLDHMRVEIREAALALAVPLLQLNKELDWKLIFPHAVRVFRNWESEKEHTYASQVLMLIIDLMSTDDKEKYLKELVKCSEPSAFSCYEQLVHNSMGVLMSWIQVTEDEITDEDVKILCSFSRAKFGPKCLYLIFTAALFKGLEPKDDIVKKLLTMAKESNVKIEPEVAGGLQQFLKANDGEFGLKEDIADMLAIQYEPRIGNTNPIILETIESTIVFGNPHMVAIYARAASHLAKSSQLKEESVGKVWKIVLDKRFDIEVRKHAAKAVCWIQIKTKNQSDKELKKLGKNILMLLEDKELLIYGLFILCCTNHREIDGPKLPGDQVDTIKNMLEALIKGFQDKPTEEGAPDDGKIIRLGMELSCYLLNRIAPGVKTLTPVNDKYLSCNWKICWVDLHPEDASALTHSDKSLTNWLLTQEDDNLQKKGHSLRVEAMLTKAEIAITTENYSLAESLLHNAKKYCKTNEILSYDINIHRLTAKVFGLQGKHGGAIRLLKRCLDKEKAYSETLSHIGLSLMALARFQSAGKIFKELQDMGAAENYEDLISLSKSLSDIFNMLCKSGVSKSLAKSEIKCLTTKMSRMQKMNAKDQKEMANWLLERGEFYDLSVLSMFPVNSWKIEFLKREVFGRAAARELLSDRDEHEHIGDAPEVTSEVGDTEVEVALAESDEADEPGVKIETVETDDGAETVELEVGVETEAPEPDVETETVEPEVEHEAETVEPEVVDDTETVEPEVVDDTETVEPEVEDEAETVEPEVVDETETVEPEVEDEAETVEPEVVDDNDTETVEPEVVDEAEIVEPEVVDEAETDEPEVVDETETVEPEVEDEAETIEPEVETEADESDVKFGSQEPDVEQVNAKVPLKVYLPGGTKLENIWVGFEKVFLQLQNYLQLINDETWLDSLVELLQFVTKFQIQVSNNKNEIPLQISFVEELLRMLKVPVGHSAKAFNSVMENHKVTSEDDNTIICDSLMRKLRSNWIKSMFHQEAVGFNDLEDDDVNKFWDIWDNCNYKGLGLTFLEDFFQKTRSVNTIQEIVKFFEFCINEKIDAETVESIATPEFMAGSRTSDVNLQAWSYSYTRFVLQKKIHATWKDSKDLEIVGSQLLSLHDNGVCTKEELIKILDNISTIDVVTVKEKMTTDLSEILTVCCNYYLETQSDWPGLVELLKENDSSSWLSNIRTKVVEKITSISSKEDKNITTLIQDFMDMNANNNDQLPGINSLANFMTSVDNAFRSGSSIKKLEISASINCWTKQDIFMWAAGMKSTDLASHDSLLPEIMAVIQRAMFLFKGYTLRNVGVMSVYLTLRNKHKGCLGKIATGEGKSGLVAALAVIKALAGNTVDIVTSSTVLAQRDAAEWTPFYKLFNLSAMENSGAQLEIDQPKPCYLCTIVYGDASTFEGDVLREEFSLLGTRGGRRFDVVIVDEVDSMFIDGSNHSTRLIDKMPQMDSLEPVFAIIWYFVGIIARTFSKINGQTFSLGKSCGMSNNVSKCVFNALPPDILRPLNLNCKDPTSFHAILQEFCSAMITEELVDEVSKAQVVNILRNSSIHKKLPLEVQTKLLGIPPSEITKTHELVTLYIQEKWDLTNPPFMIKAIEALLNVQILIYENINNVQTLSPVYHQDAEENESDAFVCTIRLFLSDNELSILRHVADERTFIAQTAETQVRKCVGNSNCIVKAKGDEIKMHIPSHLYELFNTKVDEWIQSAVQAKLYLELNRDYIIKSAGDYDTITPVDYRNTGVTQESCVWGEGLHQFLQMKHKLRVSPEYLATNFISNLSFFNRYGEGRNIFGLTGTLGDETEVALLRHMYTVNTVNVPTFKPKRLMELRAVVATSEQEWLQAILQSTNWELDSHGTRGRAVLIICKTIEDVNKLHTYLQPRVKSRHAVEFRLYSRSDDQGSEGVVSASLPPGCVVIATNLAGRGTNIKLSKEVVANGGLHVIISFLPSNLRVEEQAAGRAARAGEPGTSQLIINAATDIGNMFLTSLSIEEIKRNRAQNEKARVENIKNKLSKELFIEEKQFQKYCQLKAYIQSVRKTPKNIADHILDGIGERWAVELEETKTRCDVLDWDSIDRRFDTFFVNLRSDFLRNCAIRNPSYYILQGNDLSLQEKWEDAFKHFNWAIGLDAVYVQHAYYNRAYAIINEGGDNYKERAVSDLKKVIDIINDHTIPYLSLLHSLVETKPLQTVKDKYEKEEIPALKSHPNDPDFTKQIVNKINFNYLQIKSIQEAFQVMNSTQADVQAEYGDVEEFYKKSDQVVNYKDIQDMEDNGFIRFLYVKKKPVPWYDIFAVFVLGILQIAAGVCLCLLGFENLGPGLIAEGVSDFVTGITAAATGEFSWKDYLKNKAMSIGISLLLAGAGVALKAVSHLPKIATAITAINNSGLMKVGSSIKGFITNTIKSIQTGLSNFWQGTKTFFKTVWSNITASSQFKWVANQMSKAWACAPKILHKVKDKIVEWSNKAWEFAKNSYDYLLGTKTLDKAATTNLRYAGQLIAREGLKQGLLVALDKSMLKLIGDAIEANIRNNTTDYFNSELTEGSVVGNKLRKLFATCMGRKFETKIQVGAQSALEASDSSFGKQFYQSLVSGAVNKIKDEILKKTTEGKQTGVFALAKHLLDQIVDGIARGITLGEVIKELVNTLPQFMKHLEDSLDELEKLHSDHDHSDKDGCNNNNAPIDSRDVPRIIQGYSNDWSGQIAERMRDLIMSNIVSPPINLSLTATFDAFTNSADFEEMLEEKVKSNRTKLSDLYNRKMGSTPPAKGHSSQVQPTPGQAVSKPIATGTYPIPTESASEQKKAPEKQDKIIKKSSSLEFEDSTGVATDAILSLTSSRLDVAIELYIDQEQSLKLKERYGGGGQNDDLRNPIRILEQKSPKDGSVSYSTIMGDGDQLQLMEFRVSSNKTNNLLESVIMARDGGQKELGLKELKKMKSSLINEIQASRPVLLKFYFESMMKGAITRNVVTGRYESTLMAPRI